MLLQFVRPVGIGLAAGAGLAAALAVVLMATLAASWVHVFDPVAYIASVLVIVTSCLLAVSVPALRAAHVYPITTLRQD